MCWVLELLLSSISFFFFLTHHFFFASVPSHLKSYQQKLSIMAGGRSAGDFLTCPLSAFPRMDTSGSSGSSGGSRPVRMKSCEFEGEELDFEKTTSFSLPHDNSRHIMITLPPVCQSRNITASLPTHSVMKAKAKHLNLDLFKSLPEVTKPLAPETAATPSTPTKKWAPRKRKAELPPQDDIPVHHVWYTPSNRKYDSTALFIKDTEIRRKSAEQRAKENENFIEVRSESILQNASQVQQSREDAQSKLNTALQTQMFSIPPTFESFTHEGVTPLTSSADFNGKYFYSRHCPLNMCKSSSLYLCTRRKTNNAPEAHHLLKVCSKSKLTSQQWENLFLEIYVLRQSSNDNCGALIESLHTDDDVYLVMSPSYGETVLDACSVRPFSIREIQQLVKQIASAFHYLHTSLGIAYCALRGSDVVYKDGHCTLTDMSAARCLDPDSFVTQCFRKLGRPVETMTPLVQRDMQTLGILFHVLLYGTFPRLENPSPSLPDSAPSLLQPLLLGTLVPNDFHNHSWFAREPAPHEPFTIPGNRKDWVSGIRYVVISIYFIVLNKKKKKKKKKHNTTEMTLINCFTFSTLHLRLIKRRIFWVTGSTMKKKKKKPQKEKGINEFY